MAVYFGGARFMDRSIRINHSAALNRAEKIKSFLCQRPPSERRGKGPTFCVKESETKSNTISRPKEEKQQQQQQQPAPITTTIIRVKKKITGGVGFLRFRVLHFGRWRTLSKERKKERKNNVVSFSFYWLENVIVDVLRPHSRSAFIQ